MINLYEKCRNSTSVEGDFFVGLHYDTDIEIVFPLGYNIPEDNLNCRKSIIKLLQSLKLASNHETYTVNINNVCLNGKFPFESYLWIIDDYFKHGLYQESTKIYKEKAKGKINWKKTLKQQFYISDDSVVYLNPIIEKVGFESTLMTHIYMFCLEDSTNYLGWLFNGFTYKTEVPLVYDKKSLLMILNDKLKKVFDDKTKLMIFHMKNILSYEKSISNQAVNYSYGVTNYYYVWEMMVDKMFSNIESSLFYPKAFWHINNEEYFSTSLRPDTIMQYQEEIHILDSKYYKYGITNKISDLPNTSSIQKQIVYGDFAIKIINDSIVYNAFILPYDMNNNKMDLNKEIEGYGYAYAKWNDALHIQHNKVVLVFIDTKFLVDNWKSKGKCNSKLVEIIKNELKILEK